jgi:phage shock protein PspC (stress-responsive transcriptional regulator)
MNYADLGSTTASEGAQRLLRLRREGSIFTGVCSGIAHYVDIDPIVIRASAIVLSLVSPLMVPTYVTLAFLMPEDPGGGVAPWFDGVTLVQRLKAGFKDLFGAAMRQDKAGFHRAWRQQVDHCRRAWADAVNR